MIETKQQGMIIDDVQEIIQRLLAEQDDTSTKQLTPIGNDTDLISEQVLSSLSLISLIVAIEDKYNIELIDSNVKASDFRTISKISGLIFEKVNR